MKGRLGLVRLMATESSASQILLPKLQGVFPNFTDVSKSRAHAWEFRKGRAGVQRSVDGIFDIQQSGASPRRNSERSKTRLCRGKPSTTKAHHSYRRKPRGRERFDIASARAHRGQLRARSEAHTHLSANRQRGSAGNGARAERQMVAANNLASTALRGSRRARAYR